MASQHISGKIFLLFYFAFILTYITVSDFFRGTEVAVGYFIYFVSFSQQGWCGLLVHLLLFQVSFTQLLVPWYHVMQIQTNKASIIFVVMLIKYYILGRGFGLISLLLSYFASLLLAYFSSFVRLHHNIISDTSNDKFTINFCFFQGVVQGIVTGIRGLCNGLGPALYGLIFYIFHFNLTDNNKLNQGTNLHPSLKPSTTNISSILRHNLHKQNVSINSLFEKL